MHTENARGSCTVTQNGKKQIAPTLGVSAAMHMQEKANYMHAGYAPSAITAGLSRSRTIIGSEAAGLCRSGGVIPNRETPIAVPVVTPCPRGKARS